METFFPLLYQPQLFPASLASENDYKENSQNMEDFPFFPP